MSDSLRSGDLASLSGPPVRGWLLFAHGARDSEWAHPFQTIKARVAQLRTESWVGLAFLEHMTPTLEEAVAEAVAAGVGFLTVVPLFMAYGAHLRSDLPQLLSELRTRYPACQFVLAEPIGTVPGLQEAIARWAAG